jgi:hypothetical protein
MGIRDFIETHYSHFNAGELAKCIDSLREFLNGGGRLMITLAGAMSTAEIGKSLAPARVIISLPPQFRNSLRESMHFASSPALKWE